MNRNFWLALGAGVALLACGGSSSPSAARPSAAAASSGLKVQYHTNGTGASTNTLAPWLSVVNGGASAVDLGTLTLRYWFTADGTQAVTPYCDWAPIPGACASVSAKIVKLPAAAATTTADAYLELGFGSAAGSLAAGRSTGDIQLRLAKSDWSNFTQTNDWSFDATKTAAVDWGRVTLYQGGTLIWGTEPGGTVTTCAAAPIAPTATATAASSSEINLGWTAETPPANCSVTYDVYRSTTSGFTPSSDNRVATGLTTTSSASTGLTADTLYYFVVRAVDAFGATTSTPVSARTLPQTSTCAAAPAAPTVTASASSSSAIGVSWTAVTPPSGCAVTYSVYRSTTAGFTPSSANLVASGLTSTSSASTGLSASTTYYFVVQAVDAVGATSSAQASATTPAGGTTSSLKVQYHVGAAASSTAQLTPLLRIVNTGTSAVALGTLTLRYWFTEEGSQSLVYACDYWPSGCSNVSAKFVKMSSAAATANTYLELAFGSGAGTLAAGGATADIQSRFAKSDYSTSDQTNDWSYDGTKLSAADWNHVTLYQNGVRVWGLEPGVDTTPPSAPANLAAASKNSVSVTLSWSASTDDTGVVAYDVYKGGTLDGSTALTTYKASGLTASTAYSFTVKARDAWGNVSSESAALAVTTLGPDSTPPSVPTGLTAVSVTSTSASLSWNASTDDVGVVAYDVYDGTVLAGSPTTTGYTAIGLSPSTSYSFTVKARDARGNTSAASAALGVSTPASGGGSYALDPPDPCYAQYVVSGCTEGVASSTCGGHCRVANACSPPEDPQKGSLPMTFACPRFMTFSDEMVQAAKDDWGDSQPFVYGVVGHDSDIGGIDVGESSCCQCYQLVFEAGEPAISKTDPVAIPRSMIVQSFNTAAGGGKNFDIYMGGGGFGAFNACIPGTYDGTLTTTFGHFMYSAFPSQFPTNGGIKAVNLDQCKANSAVSATSLASASCQDQISQLCSNTAAPSSAVAAATMHSCAQTNAPDSFYHQNWKVRAKRVECPVALTRVTGCRLASQGLPQADPKAQTAATAGSGFATGYTTTTMQDCCKPSCAWSNQVAGAGLTPVGKWGAFYSCDQNGAPITAP
jgi:chitodextrinase